MYTRTTRSMLSILLLSLGPTSGLGCWVTPTEVDEPKAGRAEAPEGISPEDDSEKVQAWIAANRTRLPSAYDDVIRFPSQYRKAIFVAQTPEVKSSLFRTQLTRYRQQHPSLSTEQRTVLARATEMVTPELFATRSSSPERFRDADAQLRELTEQAIAVFGFDEARSIFVDLGPTDPGMQRGE
jgi:uncharacterized membrane protein